MTATYEQSVATLWDVSNAMRRLRKEQFGRGAANARSNFAGPDTLVCELEEILVPPS